MAESAHITDEDLVAYIDGELEKTRLPEVEAALDRDRALRLRLEALGLGERPFERAYRPLLDEAPVERLIRDLDLPVPAPATGPSSQDRAQGFWGSRWSRVAAALVLAVGVGAAGYFAGTTTTKNGSLLAHKNWRQAVAEYQVLYTRQTLNAVRQSPKQLERSFARLSGALGLEIDPKSLTVAGLQLKRGQVLGWQGNPLVQIAFLPRANGSPIAFCITKVEGADHAPKMERREGLNISHWRKNGFGLMVVGEQSDEEINRIGQVLYKRL